MAQANLDIRIKVRDDGSVVIDRIAEGFDKTGKKATGFAADAMKAFESLRGSLLQVWAAVELGERAFRAVEGFGRAFLDAARMAENYETRLKVLLGSQEAANALFAAMRDYAARVPFELENIMEAATRLAGVVEGGADEVARLMPLIGDLAAASGLSIEDTTTQVIRMWSAGAQAADMFRERGVLAMLGFQAGVSYSVEETRKRMFEAWESAESRFRGATDELAKTWDGMTSMLADKWFVFRDQVMEAGVFDALKVSTLEWDHTLADMLRPGGTLARTAEIVGQIADEWFGVTRLRGRIAAIGEEIADLQDRLRGLPPAEGGFLDVLAGEASGTLTMDDDAIRARIRELQAERERLERWLRTVEKARETRRTAPGGAPARTDTAAGPPLWIDPTESAEAWGETWAEKAWNARARAMAQLAKSAPAAVEWIDPRQDARRWEELQAVVRARTEFNPMRSLKEVSEEDKRVISEVGEWVQRWAEWKAKAERDWTDAARRGLADYRDDALDVYDEVQAAVRGAFQGMEDAMVQFVTTGKLSFRNFANAIIADLTRIIVRAQILGPVSQVLGTYFQAPAPSAPQQPSPQPYPDPWQVTAPRTASRVASTAPEGAIGRVVVVNNMAGQAGVQVNEREGPAGFRSIEVIIDRAVAGAIDRGGDTAQALQRIYGLSRRGY